MLYYVNFIDAGNCEINPHPLEIHATSLTNALQKAASMVPDDAVEVVVFKAAR